MPELHAYTSKLFKSVLHLLEDKQKKIKTSKHFKALRLKRLNKKKAKYKKQKEKADDGTSSEKEKRSKANTGLNPSIYLFILAYALAFFFSFSAGLSEGSRNSSFTLIYADDISFGEQVEALLQEKNTNGFVQLYQYEDEIIISPCQLSDDEIMIHTQFQRIIPVDSVTFVHKTFPHHQIIKSNDDIKTA